VRTLSKVDICSGQALRLPNTRRTPRGDSWFFRHRSCLFAKIIYRINNEPGSIVSNPVENFICLVRNSNDKDSQLTDGSTVGDLPTLMVIHGRILDPPYSPLRETSRIGCYGGFAEGLGNIIAHRIKTRLLLSLVKVVAISLYPKRRCSTPSVVDDSS